VETTLLSWSTMGFSVGSGVKHSTSVLLTVSYLDGWMARDLYVVTESLRCLIGRRG
jgi:hypothetical protein